MKMYVAHSRAFGFQGELYQPLRESQLDTKHTIVLPHESSSEPFDSLTFFKADCDLVIAEVSYPSTGLGIELGWASQRNIPIVATHKHDQTPSRSVQAVTETVLPYRDSQELISILQQHIETL